jgi:glyoxylase-like metal-dependent hydrolase (beta-lactamase superfamily II)
VPFLQTVVVSQGGETAAFVSDLIPTTAHLPLPWIMGYDLEPLRTLESKRGLLADAVREGWRIVFEHDPATAVGTPVMEGKGIVLKDVIAAPVTVPSVSPAQSNVRSFSSPPT